MNKSFAAPDLGRLMDKRLSIKINGNRKVSGILRGFDQYMNLVIDETQEFVPASNIVNNIGMVVIRGNAIIMMEALEKV